MTRFKHDLILRIIKTLDAVLITVPFALCWYLYYAKHIASPFYAKGDYLVVALFFALFIIFGRVYDAFLMSMQRISEIVYAQFLAVAVSDFIMYIRDLAAEQAFAQHLTGRCGADRAGDFGSCLGI